MKNTKDIYFSKWLPIFIILGLILIFLYLIIMRPWLMSFDNAGVVESIDISPADTYTYWLHSSDPLILVPYNLIGPVMIIMFFNSNFDMVFIVYIIIFIYIILKLKKYLGINPFLFTSLMLFNPLIMFQFYAPNKEFLIITSMLLLVIYIYSKKNIFLFLLLVSASFSKPEFLLLILFFLVVRKFNKKLRPYVIISMLVFLTFFYSILPNMEAHSEILLRGQTNASKGVTILLQNLASNFYLYPLIIIPRILLTIFESSTIYISISGLCFFIVIFKLFTNRLIQFKLDDDVFFISFLFIIMVSIVPFPQHRYILPLYPIFLIILLKSKLYK